MTALYLCFALIAPSQMARAHALQPGFLEIEPLVGDGFRVFWRKPDVQGRPMQINAVLPAGCSPVTGPKAQFDGSAWISVWIATCPGGLDGGVISIPGLEATSTDVLVRFPDATGAIRSQRLTPDATSFQVPADPGAWDVLGTYLPLGIEHILGGFDHLLFVFALVLLIRDTWRLVGAITAFTVAHSITMAAATLGWVALPGPPVEAVIALSIMFVASELVRRDGSSQRLSERYPWSVSFTFGLLHGFGFAGALREIGVPQTDVPLALLSFNVGVEIGQLTFVVVVIVLGLALRRLPLPTAFSFAPGARMVIISAYAIGGMSAYWVFDRLTGF